MIRRASSAVALATLFALLATGCPGQKPAAVSPAKPADGAKGPLVWKVSKSGLGFRLSNADDEADNPPERKVAVAQPLAEADAKKIGARLPKLQADPDDAKDFALRDKSVPAPRPGKTVADAFPPPLAPPPTNVPPPGPLTIERHAPEGPVELAPYLTMTFTQPMVAVTSVDELVKEHPPVRLVPEPPGKWRWLGTRTLMFQPDKRFPMATEYSVEVPAGTKSQNGQAMAKAERWTFVTPPPSLKRAYPRGSSEPRDPLLFAELDQGIDPATFLKSVELSSGRGSVALRLAEADEIEANDVARGLSAAAEKGRWIAFRPTQQLPVATAYTVKIKAGAKGAEGPRPTDKDQSYSFSTFGALRVVDSYCAWGKTAPCTPLSPFYVNFSNPIDLKVFDKSWVTASPEIPGMKVEVHGGSLVVSGRTKGRTTYKITVRGALSDVHEQRLGDDATASFDVGSAEPRLFGPEQEMVVLDPAAPRSYPVYSINEPGLRTRVYAVTPEDWFKYAAFMREWERPRKLAPPGRLVYDKVLTPKKSPDEVVATPIDLAPALAGNVGQAVVLVESTRVMPPGSRPPELQVWVQSTQLGLDAFFEEDQVLGWATRLDDGAPESGVDVQLLGAQSAAQTNAEGLARVPLTAAPGTLLFGKKGKDTVIVPEAWFGQPGYTKVSRSDALRWLVFDDRGMYKPGEEVRVKGFVRRVGMSRGGDVDAVPNIAGRAASYRVLDPRGAELTKGSATLDAAGGFDLAFKLPANANLGHARVDLTLDTSDTSGSHTSHGFQIQEFRRPEFEVSAKSTEGPHFVGGHAIATVTASYYSGGGLPNAPVQWQVSRSAGSFTPPNRSEYHFGPEPRHYWAARYGSSEEVKSETWTSRTNPLGAHRLRVDFDAVQPSYPMSLSFSAHVEDVNRQQWTGRTSMLVHPADQYVGMKLRKQFVREGENIDVDFVVADIDGKAVAGRHVVVKAARLETEQKGVDYVQKEVDLQTCEVDAGNDGTGRCSLKTTEGGQWKIWAVVSDAQGRKNQSATSLWVMGSNVPKNRRAERSAVTLVPDKSEYKPGELAEVLVVAPFAPAEGLLTVNRQGIVHVERFSMKTATQALKVKLDEALVPNAQLRVDIVGQDQREDANGNLSSSLPKRPASASGVIDVKAVAKKQALEPGGSTEIDVDVRDATGKPAQGASVALVVVDESVLALSGYKTPDPVSVFYSPRGAGVRELGMRERIVVADLDIAKRGSLGLTGTGAGGGAYGYGGGLQLENKARMASAPGAMPPPAPMASMAQPVMAKPRLEASKDISAAEPMGGVVGGETTPIQLRSDFAALALFSPKITTDAKGHATVPIKLPDNLTRYRVMAVAASGPRSFGSNESTVTARLPVMVRPSAPRFLNFGDKFELPIVVQNQTDAPIDVGVVLRATNATIDEPSAKRIKIAANDRAEVRFPAGTVKPGKARFQIGIASGSFTDASQIELPVWTPATTEAFATYGEIDEGAIAQPVQMPPNVFPQFGGLEITTSSTQLQALTDAVVYLVKYPFECNEQLASRVIAIAALRDVLSAFKAEGLPPPAALASSMNDDFEKLKRRQHGNGGWGFWQEQPWPYLTVHVAHALIRAKEKGYKPDEGMLRRSQTYLKTIESYIPAWYGPEARRALVAYSLYVRKRMGDADANKARNLIAEAGGVEKLPIEAIGWIWPTISEDKASAAQNEAIRRHVANRVTETAGAAHFVSGYKDSDWVLLHSDRRADGVLLEAMIGDQSGSTLIPKVVKGLLAHRKAGRWTNTQENAFVLLALDKYFNTYEKVTPDFVARAWLGDRFAGQHAFKGRTTEYHHVGVPMQWLATETKGQTQNLVLGKDGPGRLYYRIGMQYAPTDLKMPPADNGFVVSRVYEGVDKPDDVRRDADGTWRAKAGAKVRVRVTMVAPARRYHVALVDPIPAGLEPMNPSLAVTGEIPKDPKDPAIGKGGRYWYWNRTWYEHQNMRDERVEAFASLLWDGVWDYSYVARATTPGTFVVPPAKAEEMYSPETFGRSRGDRFIVE